MIKINYSFLLLFSFICLLTSTGAWFNSGNKVRLEDVRAITLHRGQMTTGGRSSPVPQLKCVGGSAGCSAFVPNVVQCQNVGSDGVDVQWECKADMDDSYRFGKIQVSCEGYDYPNDPFILKGSCGLEYTIDYTDAGRNRQSGPSTYNHYSYKNSDSSSPSWSIFILIVVVIGILICAMGNSNHGNNDHPPQPDHDFTSSKFRPSSGGTGGRPSPDPYGFKQDYTRQDAPPPSYDDATQQRGSTHSSTSHTNTSTRTDNNGNQPGFWSGMGLGGIAGYLFGSRNNYNRQYYGGGYRNRGYGGFGSSYGGGGYGSSWGSSSRSWGSGSSSSSSSSSSGTSRTASGYGGTSRR